MRQSSKRAMSRSGLGIVTFGRDTAVGVVGASVDCEVVGCVVFEDDATGAADVDDAGPVFLVL